MALGTRYDQQACFLARALEVVGERWTLLIVRDCFYGVRRFSDFLVHLDISRAVLTERLDALVDAGVLIRSRDKGHAEYLLTEAGLALWPTLYALAKWGEHYTRGGHPARIFTHSDCGSEIDDLGRCPSCGVTPPPYDLVVRPGKGQHAAERSDRVAEALSRPHRMLTPIATAD